MRLLAWHDAHCLGLLACDMVGRGKGAVPFMAKEGTAYLLYAVRSFFGHWNSSGLILWRCPDFMLCPFAWGIDERRVVVEDYEGIFLVYS